ncbi:hypothetical protein ABC383_08105 [Noviherbaspirillum sp. 1P10PC]|uniref:hypothetical protein n=1 Tax=Noviherbaspirillum sp. 1P10PC TaxID=3132292 RepID=UPI0039A0038B
MMYIKVRGEHARHDSATGDESLKRGKKAGKETWGQKKAPSFDGAFSKTNDFSPSIHPKIKIHW